MITIHKYITLGAFLLAGSYVQAMEETEENPHTTILPAVQTSQNMEDDDTDQSLLISLLKQECFKPYLYVDKELRKSLIPLFTIRSCFP